MSLFKALVVAVFWLCVGIALGMFVIAPRHAHAGHPMQDMAIHNQFYKTWMMPDQPTVSCCGDNDCYPTEAHIDRATGHWVFKSRDDGQWYPVPDAKVEMNRDNPDGRNHVCHRPGDATIVYCFIAGAGS